MLPRGWLKNPHEVFELRKKLQLLDCDVSFDPQSLTKSSIVAWLSGARRRIGFERPLGRELAPLLNNELVTPGQEHVVDRSLEMLQTLGIDSPEVEFALPADSAATEQVEQFCQNSHLGCGFVAINPGAGWASRRWPSRRYGAVARYLGQQYQVPSVVLWAGQERA